MDLSYLIAGGCFKPYHLPGFPAPELLIYQHAGGIRGGLYTVSDYEFEAINYKMEKLLIKITKNREQKTQRHRLKHRPVKGPEQRCLSPPFIQIICACVDIGLYTG